MKTTISILLTTLVFLANESYSQKTISLNANPNSVRSLSEYSKIDVACNIADSTIIGFIPSDILNDREFVRPAKSITLWLQDFIDVQFAPAVNVKASSLLWVIQDLSIGKDSTQKVAYSFVKVKADIYKGNNFSYEFVNTFDSTWITGEAHADFSGMIADAFRALYKNSVGQRKSLANTRFQQRAKTGSASKEEVIQKAKLSNNYPILESNYSAGIYASFAEFKNNAPSIKNFYADVNPQSNKVDLYQIVADSSSRLIENAWGLSINGELYFYSSGQLYPIEKSGNTFYLAKYLEPKTRRNQAFYWRKYVGAKQGDNNPYNDAHILRKMVPGAKGISLEATHLDFDLANFTY